MRKTKLWNSRIPATAIYKNALPHTAANASCSTEKCTAGRSGH